MSKHFRRRQFILSSITGAFVTLLSSFSRKVLAQAPERVTTPSQTTDLQKSLIPQIADSKSKPVDVTEAARRSRELNATADEIDEALDALQDRLILVKTPKTPNESAAGTDAVPILEVNPSTSLNSQEKQAANNLVTAFQEKVRNGEVTASDLQKDEQTLEFTVQTKQICSNGRVCWKFKWWGVRIRLNHCAVVWATSAGSIASLAAPPPVKLAIIFFVSVLKAFDKGCGVQIHWLWVGVSWIKSKSCSKCN
ncbi:MAG: hypothetical protein IGS39_24520 [Calothrix sp. C42_A2020_038]|nr:hypothetical protein [Calothrix sp. C42_A2020_038]